jgi:hypothetical protein
MLRRVVRSNMEGNATQDGGSRCFWHDEMSAWRFITHDYNLNIILQLHVALVLELLFRHSSPSLCNFVNILIFTLHHLRIFLLQNTTCFGLTVHHQVSKMFDWRNLLLCYYAILSITQKHLPRVTVLVGCQQRASSQHSGQPRTAEKDKPTHQHKL